MVDRILFVAVPVVALLGLVLRASWPVAQPLKATMVETSKQLRVDAKICTIHHRVQAYTMSSDVQTLYEFIGITNPSSASSVAIEQKLWAAWAAYVNENNAKHKETVELAAAPTEKDVLFVAIIELLLVDSQTRSYYDEMLLEPLLQASDRPASLRSICGRHWEALKDGHEQ
ncbi:hypothetical protein LZ32DRAFT_630121 [Colletotrichum eremochloae]|nr:hypothetical protein LZ32DRAFT_630121 [Colletotrichum eremochloae]